jgi:hypothetical protein
MKKKTFLNSQYEYVSKFKGESTKWLVDRSE